MIKKEIDIFLILIFSFNIEKWHFFQAKLVSFNKIGEKSSEKY